VSWSTIRGITIRAKTRSDPCSRVGFALTVAVCRSCPVNTACRDFAPGQLEHDAALTGVTGTLTDEKILVRGEVSEGERRGA
jgi:hypothetical protein